MQIDVHHAQTISLEQATAGVVQMLEVTPAQLRGRKPQYTKHRAIWYLVLRDLVGVKDEATAQYVKRSCNHIRKVSYGANDDILHRAETVVNALKLADFC